MANEGQIEHWNGDEANHWVTHQQRYDAMLAPFTDHLLAAARVATPDRVLDVGCGCGATTLAAQPAGTAVGLDLSAVMVQAARRRAAEERLANVSFVAGDGQTYPFPGGGFDMAISRFGVMFFDDPVAAFANLAGGLVPGGRLVFVCWQELARNPHILVPVGCQNSATVFDQGFYAARSFSLMMRPPRTGRSLIRFWERLAARLSGRRGRSWRLRRGRRPL